MSSPEVLRPGASWLRLALLSTVLVQPLSSSSSQTSQIANATYHNVSVASSLNATVQFMKRSCLLNNDCGIHEVCRAGHCQCEYYLSDEECQPVLCHQSSDCLGKWPNTRCSSNHLCTCEDDFEVEYGTRKCKYHFMNSMKEPYFYGPFVSFIAVVILLLAVWYFCCRKRQNKTTIIFHKGELPMAFISNTVATDHIPTISQGTPSQPSSSYTPFERHGYGNVLYNRTYSNGHIAPVGCARCLSHQDEHSCPNERFESLNGHEQVAFVASNTYSTHYESNHYQQSIPPPPPPPPPPPYTPLSDKLPILS